MFINILRSVYVWYCIICIKKEIKWTELVEITYYIERIILKRNISLKFVMCVNVDFIDIQSS